MDSTSNCSSELDTVARYGSLDTVSVKYRFFSRQLHPSEQEALSSLRMHLKVDLL